MPGARSLSGEREALQADLHKTLIEGSHEVRPWVRYWARYIDILLAAVVLGLLLEFGVILGILPPSISPSNLNEAALALLALFLWIFVEAILLSTWGTTPGKCLLKTTLRDLAGKKLALSPALKRSFLVWLKGIGVGVPIITVFTLAVAHRRLTREGMTSWDRDGGFRVRHETLGRVRVLFVLLVFLLFALLIAIGKTTK